MTQLIFHNYAKGFLMDTNLLSDFVANVMRDKSLTARDVTRNSGDRITHSYVNKIKNGDVKKPSMDTLRFLALGLGVPEAEVFAAVTGTAMQQGDLDAELLFYVQALSPERQADLLGIAKMFYSQQRHGKPGLEPAVVIKVPHLGQANTEEGQAKKRKIA